MTLCLQNGKLTNVLLIKVKIDHLNNRNSTNSLQVKKSHKIKTLLTIWNTLYNHFQILYAAGNVLACCLLTLCSFLQTTATIHMITIFLGVSSLSLILCSFMQTIVTILMIIPGNIFSLIDFFSFTAWLFYGATMACVLILRHTRPHEPRPYRVSHRDRAVILSLRLENMQNGIAACHTSSPADDALSQKEFYSWNRLQCIKVNYLFFRSVRKKIRKENSIYNVTSKSTGNKKNLH